MTPGQRLARGACRHLLSLNFTGLTEFVPTRGKRVDVMGLGPEGELWIIECKSGRADFRSDSKWTGYLEWCDRFFWAVDTAFPTDILPEESGLMIADDYSAEIVRMPEAQRLAPARRHRLIRKFARDSAHRLLNYEYPRL